MELRSAWRLRYTPPAGTQQDMLLEIEPVDIGPPLLALGYTNVGYSKVPFVVGSGDLVALIERGSVETVRDKVRAHLTPEERAFLGLGF